MAPPRRCAQRVVSVQTTNAAGGGEFANVDLLVALGQAGVDVLLLTNMPELAAGTEIPTRYIDLGPKLSRRNVWRVVMGFPRGLLRLRRALDDAARNGRIDVLLVHYKKEQLLAALLPDKTARAVVWAEWGPPPPQFRRGAAKAAYRFAARRAGAVMAVSEGTREALLDLGIPAPAIEVVPNAIDIDSVKFDAGARARLRRDWQAGEHTFVIGCVSRLDPKKANRTVVNAIGQMPGDILLVIAGDGEDEQALRTLAARSGSRSVFLPTPRGHVHELLSACDVQVFAPSPTEGAPRAVAFGQLVGLPVIATGPQGARDLIRPGTGTVLDDPGDARELARVLGEYRDDPGRRKAEGTAARELARARHDPELVAREAMGVFERAVERSSGRLLSE